MLHPTVRGLVFILGILSLLGGLIALTMGAEQATGGIWAIVMGAVMVFAALVQRTRYRSDEAELTHAEPGPGGGEPGFLEPRFLPTMEVFKDPTTGRLMRVYVDPRSGERRYRAEG